MPSRLHHAWIALPLSLLVASSFALGRDVSPKPPRFVAPKILVLNFDPTIEAEGGKRLREIAGWNDPRSLAQGYIDDIRRCSGGYVRYRIATWKNIDGYPVKMDGFRYDDESYLSAFRKKTEWHQPDAVDYDALIRDYGISRLIESGKIDEVWTFSMPYSGFYESRMAGQNSYWCNSDPMPEIPTSRAFVVMGFNYERGVGEMLEDLGHRSESIMTHVYGSWEPKPTHAWNRFTLYDKEIKEHPELKGQTAGCGNVHFAPNSRSDYDWGNPAPVESSCDDWLSYPRLTGKSRIVEDSDWGGGDIRKHHVWWLSHFPKASGRTDGKLNDWWAYVADFNRYPESR